MKFISHLHALESKVLLASIENASLLVSPYDMLNEEVLDKTWQV